MNRSPARRAPRAVSALLFATALHACAVASITTDGGLDATPRDASDGGTTQDAPIPRDTRTTDIVMRDTGSMTDVRADTGGTPCNSNADCHAAAAPLCDTAIHRCVECLASMDTCGAGRVCDPTTNTCQNGCHTDVDCVGGPADGGLRDGAADARTDASRGDGSAPASATHCLVAENRCVQCIGDGDCAAGSICTGNACVAGCNASQPCPSGSSCCNGMCRDTTRDPMACGSCTTQCSGTTSSCCNSTCISTMMDTMNCGGCGVVCAPTHATGRCLSGVCGIGMCDPGYANADLMASNGCECNQGSGGMSCTVAATVGPIAVGSSATATGALTATSPNNWYAVTFDPAGAPHILLTNTGGGSYVMDVQSACGAASANALSCADQAAGAVGISEYYFSDTTDMPHMSRDVPAPPATIYVRVYSPTQPSGCVTYTIVMSN